MRGFLGRTGQRFTLVQGSTPAPHRPAFAQAEAYWLALRAAGETLPARAAFQPRGLGDILEQLMLLERIAPGQVRIRIAGSEIAGVFGLAPQGMPLTALIDPASRGAVAARTEEMFTRPAITTLELTCDAGRLRPLGKAALLLLPMRGSDGDCNRALACLVSDIPATAAPRRFALYSHNARPLPQGSETSAEDMLPPVAQTATRPGPQNWQPEPRRAPHLRLVKG